MSSATCSSVLVTHIHPDHFGLAGRVREASGGTVALHPADAALLPQRYVQMDDLLTLMRTHLLRCGVPQRRARHHARRVDAGAPIRLGGPAATSCWRTGSSPTCRAGTSPPSGPRGTRRATCASTTASAGCCSRATTCSPGSRRTSRSTPSRPRTPSPISSTRSEKVAALDVDEVLPAHEYRFLLQHSNQKPPDK